MTTQSKPNFDQWLTDTVRSLIGRQKPPGNLDKLAETLTERLPSELRQHKQKIVRHEILAKFKDILKECVKDSGKILQDAAAARMKPVTVYSLLKRHAHKSAPDFPQWVVEDLLQETHGRVKAKHTKLESALSGINRLRFESVSDRTFAKTSYKSPYHALPDVKSDKLKVAVISGLQFGLPYDADIYRNLTRCGFSAARKLECDALVIGGGLLHMELKKRSGPNRLVNDVLSGNDIDFESFAEDYQAEAKMIAESGSLDPIFQTVEEEFLNVLLRGLYKVTRRPRREGVGTVNEFDKPVYVILNANDLEIPKAAAHFHLLYKQMQRHHEALALVRSTAKEVAVYEKLILSGNVKNRRKSEADLKEAKLALARATAAASRFRMSNLHRAQNKKVLKRAISYVVQRIEETIPNCTVIASGGAFVRFGSNHHIVHFISAQKSVHIKRLKSYGPDQRRDELADLTVSMQPGAVYPRKGSRENYKIEGKLLGTASFFEAPILVDQFPILEALEGFDARMPVVSAVKDEMFQGGMSTISLDNRFMPNAEMLMTETVRYNGQPKVSRTPPKYVYEALWTDPHLGAANRNWLRTREGVPIGIFEAGFELMSRSGMDRNGRAHVFGVTVADDATQGNHFGTHLRPHHNQRTGAELLFQTQDELKKIEGSNAKDREAAKEKLLREYMYQLGMFHPPHHWGTQLKELYTVLDRYQHVFKGMLLRAKDSDVIVRGISHYSGYAKDARDVGVINIGSGNHATKTLEGNAFEGEIIADRLRVALRNDPDLKGLDLNKMICGPMFQDQSIGFGTLQIGESGPKWGLHIAGTPPKRDSWYDLLHGWVQVNRQRGDVSTIFRKIPIVHKTGDKHFFGMAHAGNDTFVMGSSATHTDAFADIAGGLPENNSGLTFIGYPVDGQDRAPIVVKHLTPKTMQDFLTSGNPFPWEDFLPNRA